VYPFTNSIKSTVIEGQCDRVLSRNLYTFNVMPCSVKRFAVAIHFTWKLKAPHQFTYSRVTKSDIPHTVSRESRTSLVSNYFADASKVTSENTTSVTFICSFAGIYLPVGVVIIKSNVFKFRVRIGLSSGQELEISDVTVAKF